MNQSILFYFRVSFKYILICVASLYCFGGCNKPVVDNRPNIIICISDNQSWLYTVVGRDPIAKTPAFDPVAGEGILFANAFCDTPSCAQSRSAILTGQHIWRLEEAGNIHSKLPEKCVTYVDGSEKAGNIIGSCSKALSPGIFKIDTWWVHSSQSKMNPTGLIFSSFKEFYQSKIKDMPFRLWLGNSDAHRPYVSNSERDSGMDPTKVMVPPHLPDDPIVRNDKLDYYFEIKRFDRTPLEALSIFQEAWELDNTLVVIASDKRMPFPMAKATLYDFRTHMPLAICWSSKLDTPNRVYEGFVNLAELGPNFLEEVVLEVPGVLTALSLIDIFPIPEKSIRESEYNAKERHDGNRKGGKGYPCRAVRAKDYLYIRNYEPDRWPPGDVDAKNRPRDIPFVEVDPNPSKTLLLKNRGDLQKFCDLTFGKRPSEKLYYLRFEPCQLNNVVALPVYTEIRRDLSTQLQLYPSKTGGPYALGKERCGISPPTMGLLKTRTGRWMKSKFGGS